MNDNKEFTEFIKSELDRLKEAHSKYYKDRDLEAAKRIRDEGGCRDDVVSLYGRQEAFRLGVETMADKIDELFRCEKIEDGAAEFSEDNLIDLPDLMPDNMRKLTDEEALKLPKQILKDRGVELTGPYVAPSPDGMSVGLLMRIDGKEACFASLADFELLEKYGIKEHLNHPKLVQFQSKMGGIIMSINKKVREVCKIGKGKDCCRYLVASEKGFECAKFSERKDTLDYRAKNEIMNARGDNCDGTEGVVD